MRRVGPRSEEVARHDTQPRKREGTWMDSREKPTASCLNVTSVRIDQVTARSGFLSPSKI